MSTRVIEFPQKTVRVDENTLFAEQVHHLRPTDYLLIENALRNWFYANVEQITLEHPHLGLESGYLSYGVICKYVPLRSTGPAIKFQAHTTDLLYPYANDIRTKLAPQIYAQIMQSRNIPLPPTQPILPGLESFVAKTKYTF